MIKFFTNKKIWEKVLLALIFVILFQFAVMEPVQADVVEFGGKLISPILSLLVSLGDGIINILHSSIMGVDSPLIHVDADDSIWGYLLSIASVIITAACIIGAFVATGGLALVLGGIAIFSTASYIMGGNIVKSGLTNGINVVASMIGADGIPEDIYLPAYTYSPEEIFKGNILLFNVNFFKEPTKIYAKTENGRDLDTDDYEDISELEASVGDDDKIEYYYYKDPNGDVDTDGDEEGDAFKTSTQNSAKILQSTVSTWYNAIRNIALVLMLSILVYIGIRMLLTSVASDRAKYLNMLRDWFIGLCLLFLMHYIMAFSCTLVDNLTKSINTSVSKDTYQVYMEETDNLKKTYEELGVDDSNNFRGEDGEYVWTSNLMGYLRLKLQMNTPGGQYVGEALCFLALVVFTVMFTFTYLRRLLYMAFLTLIAPLVALTYCIDKLNDGSAQGFNKWFKEYVFNLLIQPMHLLLYYILVTSAFSTLGDNVIYSIVAIGFMIPAEKLLRSLFGFEKASTPGALGGAAAAGLMMSGVNKLVGMASKGPKGSKGEGGSGSRGSSSDNDAPSLRTNSVNSIDQMLNSGDGEQSQAERQNRNFEENQTPQQQMIDADDERFGTDDWDPQQREALLREENRNDGGMQYTDDEYRQILRDSGYDEDTINEMMGENDNSGQGVQQIDDNNEEIGESDNSETQDTEQNENTDSNSVNPNRGRFRRRAGRKLKAAGAALKAGGKRKLKAAPRFIKGVAVGAAVGTAAAAAGTVAAVAAGDPGKVGTALAVGAGGGYAAGRAAANSKFSDSISPEVKEAYNRRKNAPEYKEEIMEDHIKALKKDENIRQKLTAELGRGATRDMMKDGGHFEQFVRNGVDDVDDIIAAETLIRDGVFNNVDHATAVIQNDKRMGRKDPNKMSKKTRNEWEDTFKEEYMNAGANEERANDTVDKTMNLVHVLHQAKTGSYNRSAVNDRRTGNRRTTRTTGAGRRTRNSENTNSSEGGNNSSDNGNSSN